MSNSQIKTEGIGFTSYKQVPKETFLNKKLMLCLFNNWLCAVLKLKQYHSDDLCLNSQEYSRKQAKSFVSIPF